MNLTELTPLKKPGTADEIFDLDCVADLETLQKHADSALKRDIPWCRQRKRRRGKIAIVASGPSVVDCVDILKEWDGEIWGVNGAFHWMRHRGIKPHAFIGLDPEALLLEYLHDIPEEATYYIASQVHPSVFDHLKDRNVRLWFPADSRIKLPSTAQIIHGGSNCVGRAPNLAWLLGWREVHIFGADASFGAETHVYGGALPSNTVPVELDGKMFRTTRTMICQACEFVEQMVEWAKGKEAMAVYLYGDGLTQELYKQTLARGVFEQYLYEDWEHNKKGNRRQRRAA